MHLDSTPNGQHIVANLLTRRLHIVFCGTRPSHTSAAEHAYYAYPHNRFWKTLHEVGLTPFELQPKEYYRLLEFGIGLTDLCKVTSGNDDNIPRASLDVAALRKNIERYQPRILAFTSKNAGQAFCDRGIEYGWQPMSINSTRILVLPSTSPRAARFGYWSIDKWHELAHAVPSLRRRKAERLFWRMLTRE